MRRKLFEKIVMFFAWLLGQNATITDGADVSADAG